MMLEMMRQNSRLIELMDRRLNAEEKRREEEEAARKAANVPFGSSGMSSSSAAPAFAVGSGFTGGNRAEKYLPQIPILDHSKMGKGRMAEVEEWLRFTDVFSAWLALIDERYVNELKLCRGYATEINQSTLAPAIAARSAKVFYYLQQCFAKWDRGLELLRSVSKRQGSTAAGYETMRFIHANYSIISRMEAVHVRDASLRLYNNCTHLKKPSEIIRHLEDEFSKAEMKLSNFPDLMLKEPDRVSVLCRQFRMKYDSTLSCMESLEDGMSWWTVVSFTNSNCGLMQRERGGKGDSKGKSKSDGKGKDGGKRSAGKGNEKGKQKGDGKGKDDGKGKKKKFKKDKRRRSRSASSDGSNASTDGRRSTAGGSPSQGSVMMMRSWTGLSAGNRQQNASFEQPGVDLSSGIGSAPESSQGTRSVTQGVGSSVADVQRICSTLQVEPRDLWLVDSGATCHVLAASYASSFRIVRSHGVSPKLFNASSDEIAVEGLVDIELSFHRLEITLQEVIVARVAFNALSPWAGAEHGWKTYLGKSGCRMFKGRKSIKLSAANRAWWAISGKKGKGSLRGRDESAPEPMELDSLPVCDSGSPAAGAPKKKPEALKSCLKTPNGSSDPGSSGESVMSAASSVPIGPRKWSSVGMSLPICDTPFAYMLRGMRSVACVTEEHEFFDCDQGFAEVFELDFPELCCGDHDFACSGSRMLAAPLGRTHDLSSRTHHLSSRTHDLSSRTHDLCDRTHDLCSRMHDLGSCRWSESVLCRMQVAMSQCLKVARHGLKVAQRVLHVLCPDLRAGFCQALRFHSAEASELNSGERCLFERERSARFPSRRHLLPKLLFLILLVLWGYDGPYGGGCYAFGSVGFGCWNECCRGWWNNNGFGRSMGAMGSYSPSHGVPEGDVGPVGDDIAVESESEDPELIPDKGSDPMDLIIPEGLPQPDLDLPDLDDEGDTRMDEGVGSEAMEVDSFLVDELMAASLNQVYTGPDLRTVSKEVDRSFTLLFCGARITCVVPKTAVSETSGEHLQPKLLETAMRLELEELESFRVGKVITEQEAKVFARRNGRRVLTSRWVNTVKRPGLIEPAWL